MVDLIDQREGIRTGAGGQIEGEDLAVFRRLVASGRSTLDVARQDMVARWGTVAVDIIDYIPALRFQAVRREEGVNCHVEARQSVGAAVEDSGDKAGYLLE